MFYDHCDFHTKLNSSFIEIHEIASEPNWNVFEKKREQKGWHL